jgi:pyruvyl transferase EpsO
VLRARRDPIRFHPSASERAMSVLLSSRPLETRMADLSRQLDVCAPVLQGELVLLDYPVHGNVGDLLMWQGERAFLKRHGKRFLAQYSMSNTGRRASVMLDRCSTICIHGGGNFGDLWPWFQKFREGIIQRFPQKRIVMFPQSIHYADMNELDRACQILAAHPDLHIFLRDENSLAMLRARGIHNLALCPDMAHALWGVLSAPEPTLSDPLYVLRRDTEAGELPAEIATKGAGSVDWEDLLIGRMGLAYRLGVRINERDGWRRLNNRLPAYAVWNRVSDMLVDRAIDLVSPHQTIVTNRLHGVILATLLKRQAVAFDNSYGKVSSYVSLWLRDVVDMDAKVRA